MVFFNWATMQMAAKIVYYGPGLCGKTTNLSYIYAKTAPGSRGEMVSLETETDRTLFFDLLPIEVGKVGGFRTRLQLYTVPGQVFYNTTRKLVVKGVDGLVFVADSQRPMADANVESFKNLDENLREMGLTLDSLPARDAVQQEGSQEHPVGRGDAGSAQPGWTWECFEAVAVEGHGVFETLKAITKLTLKSLRKRMATQESAAAIAAGPQPATRPSGTGQRWAFSVRQLRPCRASVGGSGGPVGPARGGAAGAAAEGRPGSSRSRGRRFPVAGGSDRGGRRGCAPEPVAAQPSDAGGRGVCIVEEAATTSPSVETLEEPLPMAEEVAAWQRTQDEAPQVEEVRPPHVAEEAARGRGALFRGRRGGREEAAVEFATTSEAAQAVAPAEMRHVKVGSSLDILAELETLRKSSTLRPEARPSAAASAPSFDLDSLLQSSVNSRQEVKRKVEERGGHGSWPGQSLPGQHSARGRPWQADSRGEPDRGRAQAQRTGSPALPDPAGQPARRLKHAAAGGLGGSARTVGRVSDCRQVAFLEHRHARRRCGTREGGPGCAAFGDSGAGG